MKSAWEVSSVQNIALRGHVVIRRWSVGGIYQWLAVDWVAATRVTTRCKVEGLVGGAGGAERKVIKMFGQLRKVVWC